jgi:hypothetical protein
MNIHPAITYSNMFDDFTIKLPSVTILVTNFLFHFSISECLKEWCPLISFRWRPKRSFYGRKRSFTNNKRNNNSICQLSYSILITTVSVTSNNFEMKNSTYSQHLKFLPYNEHVVNVKSQVFIMVQIKDVLFWIITMCRGCSKFLQTLITNCNSVKWSVITSFSTWMSIWQLGFQYIKPTITICNHTMTFQIPH